MEKHSKVREQHPKTEKTGIGMAASKSEKENNDMRKKEMVRLKGTVKWFDVRRGFGFLSDEDGLDYFVHFSEIQGEGFKKLRNGQQVTFEAGEDTRGRSVARNVVAEPDAENTAELAGEDNEKEGFSQKSADMEKNNEESDIESGMGVAEKMGDQSDAALEAVL